MKWFRYYSEALDDPKVQLLPAATFKGWVNVLSIVNETEPSRGPKSGYLPRRVEDIAYKLHMDADATTFLLQELVTEGLLEERSGRFRVHNWPRRQFVSDDVTARVQGTRKKQKRNVTSTASETEEIERRGEEDLEGDLDGDKEAEAESGRAIARIRRRLRDAKIACESKAIRESISEALAASSLECIEHCIEEAERHNKLSWAYVDVIRIRHAAEGCPSPDLQTRTERLIGRKQYA